MKPSAPLYSGMKTSGPVCGVARRVTHLTTTLASRSQASSKASGWRNISIKIPRDPQRVSPVKSNGARDDEQAILVLAHPLSLVVCEDGGHERVRLPATLKSLFG
jgi:hypothetical protein